MLISEVTSTGAANPWLEGRRPNPQARLRLFCFPYAGGGAMIYRRWRDELPATVEVCPVQLPGRETRLLEKPFTALRPLTEALGRAMWSQLDMPFAFFGHSMGAVIGFELARWLRRERGPSPVHLFVSGRTAPHLLDSEPPTYNLPDPEFLEDVRRLNGTPAGVLECSELVQLLLPLLRADFGVCQTYTPLPEPPLDCPITAFGGLQDDRAGRGKLEGWREHTAASFSLRMLPGDHFFVNSSRRLLLQTLSQDLRRIVDTLA